MSGVLMRRGDYNTDNIERKDQVWTWGESKPPQVKKRDLRRNQPYQSVAILVLDSCFQNCEIIKVCCLSHPICGTSLWQPEQTRQVVRIKRRIVTGRQLLVLGIFGKTLSLLLEHLKIHFKYLTYFLKDLY